MPALTDNFTTDTPKDDGIRYMSWETFVAIHESFHFWGTLKQQFEHESYRTPIVEPPKTPLFHLHSEEGRKLHSAMEAIVRNKDLANSKYYSGKALAERLIQIGKDLLRVGSAFKDAEIKWKDSAEYKKLVNDRAEWDAQKAMHQAGLEILFGKEALSLYASINAGDHAELVEAAKQMTGKAVLVIAPATSREEAPSVGVVDASTLSPGARAAVGLVPAA